MRRPWYWYLDGYAATGMPYVRTYVGRPGEVRGSTWVIPAYPTDGGPRVNLIMKPVEGTVDGEWVCVRRETPPPRKCLDLNCLICYPAEPPGAICSVTQRPCVCDGGLCAWDDRRHA